MPPLDPTVNADGGIVLDAQVNVLLDTEAKVSGGGEVDVSQFVFLDLEATLQDFLSLGTADGTADGNLFVTTNAEGTHGVASLGEDGQLASQLFQHLGGTGQSITRFTNANVQAKLFNAQFTHDILFFGFGRLLGEVR